MGDGMILLLAGFVGGCVASGLIGAAVGSSRGNGGAGFWWGFLLGPIGWIIAALIDDTRKRCKRCKAVLEGSDMKRCPACGAMLVKKSVASGWVDPVDKWEASQRREDDR